MALTANTRIMTNKGWKSITDISGHDKVLVRNFIGDAEFIQPFALKKTHYEGDVIKFGGAYWAVTVTPDHKIVYDRNPQSVRSVQETAYAKDVKADRHKFFHRQFRYIREDKADEYVNIYGDIDRRVSISDEDWYTIVAYTVMCGYISKDKNPRLKYMVNPEKMLPLISILDMLGVSWSYGEVSGSSVITVNRDNNLARKLKLFLGARARRDMYLPNKMVYGSSQALMKHFIGTVTTLVAKPAKNRPKQLVFNSANRKLLEGIKMMCMFCGYGFSMSENHGEYVIYVLPRTVSPWTARFVEKSTYSGYIYEIDLFDGLIYVTERSLPVWMSPK